MAKRKSKKSRVKPAKVKQTWIGKFFHLSWKKFFVVFGFLVLFVILHNFSNELFGLQDPVAFLIVIILLVIYLIKAIIYTITHSRIYPKNSN